MAGTRSVSSGRRTRSVVSRKGFQVDDTLAEIPEEAADAMVLGQVLGHMPWSVIDMTGVAKWSLTYCLDDLIEVIARRAIS